MVWSISKGVLSTQIKRAKVTAFMAVFLLTVTSLASGLTYLVKQAYATTASNVVINEVMANPSSGHEWVELYNPTSSAVDMSDWRIKHNSVATNFGGVISSGTTIPAHGFYVQEDDGQLPNSGATVKLFVDSAAESANTPLDTLTYPSLNSGESYGLGSDGDPSAPQVFTTPTKGSANSPTSGPVEDTTTATYYASLQAAVDGANVGDIIQLNSDLSVGSRVNITKQLTIDGQGNTLSPTFTKTSNSNNATLEIAADNVTIENLTIDGSGGTNLHGINTYLASNALIDNVAINNNGHDGLVVNGSSVTVNNISTSNNTWGGIDVDQGSGVGATTTLTVNGTSTHSEPVADILVDDKTNPNVSVVDTNNQYDYTDSGNVRVYRLKPATPPCSSSDTTFDRFSNGNVNGQHGWKSTGPFDQSIVYNTYGYPTFGCKSLRLSNAVTSGSFGDQTFSYSTVNEAGEADSTNGGQSSGTRQNHYEAQFDIASTQSTEQSGMAVSVSPDRGDGSRMSYLSFADTPGGIDVIFYDVQGTDNPANFVPTDLGTISRTEPHTIKFVIDYKDGPSNDVVKVYIDGALVHTGTTWENYYRYDPEANAEQTPRTTDSLIFRAGGTAAPSNSGKGFLFDNVDIATSTISPLSTPTHVSPADGSFKTTANQTLIDWNNSTGGVSPIKYKYESSHSFATNSDGSFTSPVYTSGLLTDSQIPTPSTPAGVYYWHVKAIDNSGNESDWSSPWKLTVDNTAPNTPTPVNPNSDTNPFFTNAGFTQSWSNESASGAVKYNYESCYQAAEPSGDSCDSGASHWAHTYTGTSKSVGSSQPESHFFWHIQSEDAAGNKSPWSDWREITIDHTRRQ